MVIEDHDQNETSGICWWSLILAPILVPMFVGMYIEEHSKKK